MFDDKGIEENVDDVEEELDESDLGDESATEQRIREASSKNQQNNSNNQMNVNNNQTNTGNINNNSNVNNKSDSNRSNHANIGDAIKDAGSGIKNKGEKISQNAQKKEARAQKLENLGKKVEKISGGKIGGGMQKYAQKRQEKAQKQEELGNKIQDAGEKVEDKGNAISKKLDELNPINKMKEAAQDTANTITTVVKTASKVAIKHLLTFLAPFAIPILIGLFMAFIILLLIYALFNEQGITDDGSMNSEFYSAICVGNIRRSLVDEITPPVEIKNSISSFDNQYSFGIADGHLHSGVDLNVNTTGNTEGDDVYSVHDGIVLKSTFDGSYRRSNIKGGWVDIVYSVSLEDGNYSFLVVYGGLSPQSLTLKSGDQVTKGQVIGKIGSVEDSEIDIPSLHFGFYDNNAGTYLDPSNIFIPCVLHEDADARIINLPQETLNHEQVNYTVTCYESDGWHLGCGTTPTRIASGTNQKEVHNLWVRTGARYKNGIATMYVEGVERYLVATTSTYGPVGTIINVKLANGEVLPCVIADQKSSGDSNWSEYGHLYGNSISIIEFEVDSNKYRTQGSNPATWGQDWDTSQKVVSVSVNHSIFDSDGVGSIDYSGRYSITSVPLFVSGSNGSTHFSGSGTTGVLQSPFDTDGSVSKLEAAASQMTYDHKDGIPCGSGKTLRRSNSGGNCEYHGGNDYSVSVGTPVYAVDGGTVIHSGSPGGGWEALGIYVALTNTYGGQTYTTTYQHLSSVAVQEGQTVNKGQLIGYSGNTGQSSGPHLHLEIIKGEFSCKSHSSSCRSPEYRVNPYEYIAGSKRGQIYFDGSRN